MKIDLRDVEHIVLVTAKAGAVFFPVIGPALPALEALAAALEEAGAIPSEASAVTADHLRDVAAGMAAARASAVTSYKAKR